MFFSVLLRLCGKPKSAAGRINNRIRVIPAKKAPSRMIRDRALVYSVRMELLLYQFLYNFSIVCYNVQHVWCRWKFIQVVYGKPVKPF